MSLPTEDRSFADGRPSRSKRAAERTLGFPGDADPGPAELRGPQGAGETSPYAAGFVFGPFHMDVASHRLWRGRRDIRLRPKSWDILRYLIERAGLLVTP